MKGSPANSPHILHKEEICFCFAKPLRELALFVTAVEPSPS